MTLENKVQTYMAKVIKKKTTKNKVEDSYNISDIVYQSISVTNNRQPGTGDLLSMLFYCRRWCRWWYVVDI